MSDEKPKMGRPTKTIDWKIFDSLCAVQCTAAEISNYFEIDEDTLNAIIRRERNQTFSECFGQKSSRGKVSLRRRQYQLAESGNPTMLIWLGKQWLGQQDQIKTDEDDFDPISLAYDPKTIGDR